jgi:glycosyltransferase involved in cell wall biosynthesis
MPYQGYSHFCPRSKVVPFTPVYYGYDADFFKPTENVERKRNSFLTIGNLADPYSFKRKGYDLIISLAYQLPEVTFTLVGWDSSTKLEVPENIRLLPFKSQEEILRLFSEHQFYFQLSIMEGFPNALAEAMLCGCIPIGSNVSGIPYIIKDTGVILKHRRIEELKELIDNLLTESDEQLKQRSIAARERIKSEFTYENRKSKIINIIDSFKAN